jgi:hypothetical protein
MEIKTTTQIIEDDTKYPKWNDEWDNTRWVRLLDIMEILRRPKTTKKHIIDVLEGKVK